jgi:hypothetical protein
MTIAIGIILGKLRQGGAREQQPQNLIQNVMHQLSPVSYSLYANQSGINTNGEIRMIKRCLIGVSFEGFVLGPRNL